MPTESGFTAIAGGGLHSLAIAAPPDTTDPTVTITTPPEGAVYSQGDEVIADYTCADDDSGIASCDGDVDDGTPIDTSAAGDYEFTVTGTDIAGNAHTVTHAYSVEGLADLDVSMSADPTGLILPILLPQVEFTAEVTNHGPADARNVQVQLTYAAGLVSPEPSAGCVLNASDRTVVCTVDDLPASGPDAARSVVLRAGLLALGPQRVTATLIASEPTDPNDSNDTDHTSCTALTGLVVLC